jgi:hypothetical protein
MVRFRWHRGLLDDSLATAVKLKNKDEIEKLIKHEYRKWGETKFKFTYDYIGFDERCGWNTWYVCLNGRCVGMAELE